MTKILNLKDSKIVYIMLMTLVVILPFRDLLALYIHSIIKLLPDILIVTFFGLFLIVRRFKIKIDVIDVLFIIFLIIGFITTVIVRDYHFIPYIVQVRSISVIYIVYFMLKNIQLNNKYIYNLITIMKVIIYLLVGFALIELIFSKEILFPLSWKESITYMDNFIRTYSLLNNPNTFAAYLLFSLMFFHKYSTNFWEKESFPILSAILIGIIVSVSRSTWILLFIFLIVIVIGYIMRKGKKIRLIEAFKTALTNIVTVVISISIVLVLSKLYLISFSSNEKLKESGMNAGERLNELFDSEILEKSSTNGRVYSVVKGIEIFKDYPILGTGYGTYGSAASLMYGSPIYEKYDIHNRFYSDNEYIKILVETGIIGTIIFSLFIFSLYYKNRKENFKLLFLFMFLMLGIFYNVFEIKILAFYFWISMGLKVTTEEREYI